MSLYRPSDSFTPVVKNLVIANVLVYIAQYYFRNLGRPLEPYLALWSIDTGYFKVWQLITHMFMHSSFTHILYNMLGLWMFGSRLESAWGSKRFLQFYFMCGLAAGFAQLGLQDNFSAIGASGAVMGILAAFAYLYPNEYLYLYLFIPVKAKYAISAFILLDIVAEIAPSSGDMIAHYAHLGGAVAGLLIVFIWNRTNRRNFY